MLGLRKKVYHLHHSLSNMDEPLVPAPGNEPQISRREFLAPITSGGHDKFKATVIGLFAVSATVSQVTVMSIIFYLIGLL